MVAADLVVARVRWLTSEYHYRVCLKSVEAVVGYVVPVLHRKAFGPLCEKTLACRELFLKSEGCRVRKCKRNFTRKSENSPHSLLCKCCLRESRFNSLKEVT